LTKALKNKIAIVGASILAGKYEDRSGRLLQAEAARMAIHDAGLKVSDIDGAMDIRLAPGSGDFPVYTDAFPRVLGMPCRFYLTVGRGAASLMFAIVAAAKFLEIGAADYIVLANGTKDWSRSREAKKEGAVSLNMVEKQGYWGKPFGDNSAASHHGFFARRHMHEFGTKPEHFGNIAVAQRAWAQMNPLAQRQEPLTIEEYLASPTIIDPYRLWDMSLMSDGAAAIVLTTAERARDLDRKSVAVLGAGFGEMMERSWWDKTNYTGLAVDTAKKVAFQEADISIEDVDVAGLYDCFTAEVLHQVEDYGWCGKGEGGPFIAEGHTAPGGRVPINTSGGLLSAYHLGEWTHVIEIVNQLRGEAGERQLPGARIGLASGHGGEILSPGMCSTHATLVLGAS
jgi:acetyl-CoA acetyltransferase